MEAEAGEMEMGRKVPPLYREEEAAVVIPLAFTPPLLNKPDFFV